MQAPRSFARGVAYRTFCRAVHTLTAGDGRWRLGLFQQPSDSTVFPENVLKLPVGWERFAYFPKRHSTCELRIVEHRNFRFASPAPEVFHIGFRRVKTKNGSQNSHSESRSF